MATEKPNVSIADEWLEEDNLELLECWARDGYTLMDIANRIGVGRTTLDSWRKKYPEKFSKPVKTALAPTKQKPNASQNSEQINEDLPINHHENTELNDSALPEELR